MTLKQRIIQARLPQRTLLLFAMRAILELDWRKANEEGGAARPSLAPDFSELLFYTKPEGKKLYEEFDEDIEEQTQEDLKEFAMQCLKEV